MNKSTLLGLILLSVFYFGTGGFVILQNDQLYEKSNALQTSEVEYEGIKFKNKEVLNAALQQELILKVYPYADKIPSTLCFIITAISFGAIGSIAKIINDTILKKQKIREIDNLLLIPVQGGIIGLMILGISYILPVLLTNETESLKPITIVFLSLFGGLFYLHFYKWLLKAIDKAVNRDIEKL
jgi:hypothetical protein